MTDRHLVAERDWTPNTLLLVRRTEKRGGAPS